mmetsp:Transcript_29375/g.34578  ORF Transcript_29375/g.34578 Transcript_29375/m.34578 type:complete len:219 (+) Transcript_29375:120-776(+)|eukprot:CAMPEP_0114334422 /NCGR_PEP_ID=MMETSP0101-20121206/4366_1 /TAXON_ID=38822 ORGANISM="Pteridomonas danica, Strain PT" /NCGR_SAMPLE_ID=MMETSP0101 /ASSEMBLY_ACC=CAM_ASM_000211 /LENGTH=218 /DNA_ID=CAMNT_0001465679 /DNA_START=68 /DNA_END=724 /DNA_ORIENTATION=+
MITVFRSKEDDSMMRAIARRQPVLRLAAEENARPIAEERKKPQRGGYIYAPLLSHPLDFGMEKFENDKAMKRLRLSPLPKRIEAATALNLPWCVEELYMTGSPCDIPNKSGYTPLHLAAARNFPKCVEVLLNMKIDIKLNATTNKGYTALYLARACQAPECARLILDAGGAETAIKPMKGYRSILDMPIDVPSAVSFRNRAVDDRAKNLNLPPYFGQY